MKSAPCMVRVAALMKMPLLLAEQGVDADALLATFGLSVAYLKEPENRIPFSLMGEILERCAEQARCPHFGLWLGQQTSISALGVVGFLAQSAPDLHSALGILRKYYFSHNRGAVITMVEDGEFFSFRYTIVDTTVAHRAHILAGALAITNNLFQGVCGARWRPTQVRLAHAAPADLGPFRDAFACSVLCGSTDSAIVFPRHFLNFTLPQADPLLHKMMWDRLHEQLAGDERDLASQVRDLVLNTAASGTPSVDVVAKLFGLEVRTFNRRLAALNTSFAEIRDSSKHGAACRLLSNTEISIGEIAEMLGYSNTGSFTRAFRRSEGITPSRWRNENGERFMSGEASSKQNLR